MPAKQDPSKSDEPVYVNDVDDFDCAICGRPLKGYKGYKACMSRPIDAEGDLHEIFRAIHVECYRGKMN